MGVQRAKVAELLAYCADLDKLTVDARNMSGLTATAASGVKVRKKEKYQYGIKKAEHYSDFKFLDADLSKYP